MRLLQVIALEMIAIAMALACALAPAHAGTMAGQDGVPLTRDQERGLRQGDTFRECTDCPEMVVLPAGSFTMGSPSAEKGRDDAEGPQHVVTISQPFAVGKFHVTVGQFAAFVRDTGYATRSKCFEGWPSGLPYGPGNGAWHDPGWGSWRIPGFAQDGTHPVVCLSWDEAKAYVAWLAKKTGQPYRLLSEAEFEYAARGRTSPGSYPRFWFGDSESDLCRYGDGGDQKAQSERRLPIVDPASCNDGYAYTSPAGHYRPNAFGLYDMAGNAWQWIEDCWHKNYAGAPADGSAWTTDCDRSRGRVLRGGSYMAGPGHMRAASRSYSRNTGAGATVGSAVGFRLARTLIP